MNVLIVNKKRLDAGVLRERQKTITKCVVTFKLSKNPLSFYNFSKEFFEKYPHGYPVAGKLVSPV